ncbi:MAG: hypothetical protein AB1425_06960 [Actinomycetota bacterium]
MRGTSDHPLSGTATSTALALLLAAALLLCHGALGGFHELEVRAIPAHHAEHSPHPADGPGTAHDHPLAKTGYAAALFALLLGTAHLLLSRKGGMGFARAASGVAARGLPAAILNLPRGPTAPLLQVFRL